MTHGYAAQRRFPRVPSENALLVHKLGPDAVEGFARTRVVGLGGCMFVSDEPLGVGAHLELLISVHGQVARALGQVVYELPAEGGCLEVGVEFIEVPAE
ncbi:MAG: PilZ domain-containing protein, partial [Deferrisomatales bacterium]